MKIYQQTSQDKVSTIQNTLQKHFLPADTWGSIETQTTPDQAAQNFRAAILSEAAAAEQAGFELLSQRFPDKYGHTVPAAAGNTIFRVSCRSWCADPVRYQLCAKPIKKIFTSSTMGAGMKIHTRKIRNRFEPGSWRRESWFFVAYALSTGNENEFAPISRYS